LLNNIKNQSAGLTSSNAVLGDLVNRDIDGDGVLDWEESLWGTDPTKKETTDGIPDITAIAKLKLQNAQSEQRESLLNGESQEPENLTETDKFSREFFSTIAALNQSGAMDQATADKLSTSLAERIQNVAPRKVYLFSDIKLIKDNSKKAVITYNNSLGTLFKGYKGDVKVLDILKKFVVDENNVDISVLEELNPIIQETSKVISGMIKTSVPQEFAQSHLDVVNGFQIFMENISDIKLYEADVIVALGAISQFEKNINTLESYIFNLQNSIWQKLKN